MVKLIIIECRFFIRAVRTVSGKERKGCYDCEYYISSIGDRGYCKLYRHETTMPDIACPRYEKKEIVQPELQELKTSKKTFLKKNESFLALASFFACTVLTVILLMFGLYFAVTIYGISVLSLTVKILIVLATIAIISGITFLLFNIGKKYMLMRLFELFLTVFVVVFVLINYEVIWFQFHGLVVSIIDFIFGSMILH